MDAGTNGRRTTDTSSAGTPVAGTTAAAGGTATAAGTAAAPTGTGATAAAGSGGRTGRLAASTTLRGLLAASVLLSAVVHLELWAQGMRAVAVVGPAFLLNAVGGLVIALAVLLWRHWLPLLAALGFGGATLGAFVVSTTVGLFGVHEQWDGVPQLLSAVSEVLAIVLTLAALVVEAPLRRFGRH